MRKLALFIFGLGLASATQASVTLSIDVGGMKQSNGTSIAAGTIGILVVDSSGDGFSGSTAGSYSSIVGTQLTANQNLFGSTDDTILKVFSASDLSGSGDIGFSGSLSGYTYGGAIGQSDKLAIYWFPGVTTSGATLGAGQSQMGFFRSDTFDSLSAPGGAGNGYTTFALPADGASLAISYYTTSPNLGGGIAPSSLQAFSIGAAVPEPSRALLLGLGMVGMLARRRRK